MKKNVILGNNAVGYVIRGNKHEVMFPRYSRFTIDGNTVIADVTGNRKNRNFNYKVVSLVDGEIVSEFECIDVAKLGNGNYKLTFPQDYKRDERALIYNPVLGKAVSKLYDGMSEIDEEHLILCKLTIDNIDRGRFNYFLKINEDGEIVTDLFNEYTRETIPYEAIEADENDTFRLMEDIHSKNFVICYNLERKR